MRRTVAAIAVALLASTVSANAADAPSPEGTWVSYDEGKPRSHIHLRVVDGELTGVVERLFLNPGEPDPPLCVACAGALKNAPIEGLPIVSGLRLRDGVWSGGSILDPESGSVYTATITVAPDGATLTARGYVGLPLFGRSVTWTRLP